MKIIYGFQVLCALVSFVTALRIQPCNQNEILATCVHQLEVGWFYGQVKVVLKSP